MRVYSLAQEKGISEKILADTLSDLSLWSQTLFIKHGRWGLREIPWLRSHFTFRLFALGRLQYRFDSYPFSQDLWVDAKGRSLIVDEQGQGFDPWGKTALSEDSASSATEGGWKLIAKKGSPTLSIHIPATGLLSTEACKASFEAAMEFFPRVFPEREFRCLTCVSWLLNPVYERVLEPKSNLPDFLRQFHLFPFQGASDAQMWERVFGKRFVDPLQAPRMTSLQRAILDAIKEGLSFEQYAGVIIPEGFTWGTQLSRQKWKGAL